MQTDSTSAGSVAHEELSCERCEILEEIAVEATLDAESYRTALLAALELTHALQRGERRAIEEAKRLRREIARYAAGAVRA